MPKGMTGHVMYKAPTSDEPAVTKSIAAHIKSLQDKHGWPYSDMIPLNLGTDGLAHTVDPFTQTPLEELDLQTVPAQAWQSLQSTRGVAAPTSSADVESLKAEVSDLTAAVKALLGKQGTTEAAKQ